jgi:hypothetical protein
MQQEILDTLFGDRDILTELIIKLAPETPAQAKQLHDITNSTKGIDTAVQQLDDASTRLKELAQNFKDAANAIALVDQLVSLAASLVLAAV